MTNIEDHHQLGDVAKYFWQTKSATRTLNREVKGRQKQHATTEALQELVQ